MEHARYPLNRAELQAWIVEFLSELLGLPPGQIDPAQPFDVYGLDSSGAVGMSGDLEDLLGVGFDAALVYDHPTVEALVAHLVDMRLVIAA
jgi:acyl carrier protein